MLKFGKICDTIFYQGIGASQTQVMKYVHHDQKIQASTGEIMWSVDNNQQKGKDFGVIFNPYLGPEISDINLNPFSNYWSYLNPITLYETTLSRYKNYQAGIRFASPEQPIQDVKGFDNGTVRYHVPIHSEISIGQENDIQSHYQKYQDWLENKKSNSSNRKHLTTGSDNLILFGVSRGTAATFLAFSRYKYPEVKLVILEGAIDSIDSVLESRLAQYINSPTLNRSIVNKISKLLSMLTKYQPEGPAPIKSVNDFPEDIPVVFITSIKDKIVRSENTQRIAQALAEKGKNDIYVLTLTNSSHPNYTRDDKNDIDLYHNFIHAIYQRYGLEHDVKAATLGEPLLKDYTLFKKERGEKSN